MGVIQIGMVDRSSPLTSRRLVEILVDLYKFDAKCEIEYSQKMLS